MRTARVARCSEVLSVLSGARSNKGGPRCCYDESKRAADTLFFDYHRECGVAIRVARIFNTYGPHVAAGDGRVVFNFVVRALEREPRTV